MTDYALPPAPATRVQLLDDQDAVWDRSPESPPMNAERWTWYAWKEIEDQRLCGIAWWDGCEIDCRVVIYGQVVGVAGCPWGGPGILVTRGRHHDTVMTLRAAIEFYQRSGD